MAIRDSMRSSAAAYLRPGECVQAVIGAQTASQWVAMLGGFLLFMRDLTGTGSWPSPRTGSSSSTPAS